MSEDDWAPTFGVEMELCFAELLPGQERPDPWETRILNFSQLESISPERITQDREIVMAVQEHIRGTFRKAEIQVNPAEDINITGWVVKDDYSILPPEGSKDKKFPYRWIPIEIVSPAFYFSQAALDAVRGVCALLSSTYCINVNESTGLHVHVGNGNKDFTLPTLKKLVSFFWAFTPQLNTLHPPSRQDSGFRSMAGSIRELSKLAKIGAMEGNSRVGPGEAIALFLACESREELLYLACDETKCLAYNLTGLRMKAFKDLYRPTIEFRQHAGSLDGEAVAMAIRTFVGIVEYCAKTDIVEVDHLLRIVFNEKWEKLTDGKNEERQKRFGPILAEGDYTVIQLLKDIGQVVPAAYYQNRGLYRYVATSDYDEDRRPKQETKSTSHEQNYFILKHCFELLVGRERGRRKQGRIGDVGFNPQDPIWKPFRGDRKIDFDQATEAPWQPETGSGSNNNNEESSTTPSDSNHSNPDVLKLKVGLSDSPNNGDKKPDPAVSHTMLARKKSSTSTDSSSSGDRQPTSGIPKIKLTKEKFTMDSSSSDDGKKLTTSTNKKTRFSLWSTSSDESEPPPVLKTPSALESIHSSSHFPKATFSERTFSEASDADDQRLCIKAQNHFIKTSWPDSEDDEQFRERLRLVEMFGNVKDKYQNPFTNPSPRIGNRRVDSPPASATSVFPKTGKDGEDTKSDGFMISEVEDSSDYEEPMDTLKAIAAERARG